MIILNMKNSKSGFPNQMVDDPVLNLLRNTKETYPFSEERRLFYVALTRTKNYVYLISDRSKPSYFIREIVRDYEKYIKVLFY